MFIITYFDYLFLSSIYLCITYSYIVYIYIYQFYKCIHKFCFFKDSLSALQIESSVHGQNDKVIDFYFCKHKIKERPVLERTLKIISSQSPAVRRDTATIPGCPEPRPAWPWTLPQPKPHRKRLEPNPRAATSPWLCCRPAPPAAIPGSPRIPAGPDRDLTRSSRHLFTTAPLYCRAALRQRRFTAARPA